MTVSTLNGQVIGQAENATRAVLDRVLATADVTFHQWVGLNLIETAGGSIEPDQFVLRMVNGLKVDDWVASGTISELASAGLVSGDQRLTLTQAGHDRHATIRAGVNGITERLYADLPADDLAIAARVLTTLTERANAELAAG
jgi:hypothetical protein